ncbi:MAG: c-type cytochrome [Flavobacteriales bacterium]|nr:c-type cytochrome [Flavobacteriales bacterium]
MSVKPIIWSALGLLVFATGCAKDEPSEVKYDPTPYAVVTGDFPVPNLPPDNPLTQSGVQLGKMLFFETKLSLDNSMSCGTCHRQEHAFTDTNRFSLGVHGLPGKRQAMTVFNMAWNSNGFFWDGRAPLLRDQALMPIIDSLEMAETLENVVAKLTADRKYRDQFKRAFDDEPISATTISLALEQFMLSIVSVESKYDRYLRGEAQLTTGEERGRELFFAEYNPFFPDESGADCAHCHSPKNFENDEYMNNGLDAEADIDDFGLELTTGLQSDRGKMKVTSLRNIEVTAPYMHDGRFETLEEVVEHYNSGIKSSSTLDVTLANTQQTGLMLTEQDKADLVAFLKTFTDEVLLTNQEYANPFK